jgi:cytochrome c peroxidase
MHADLSLILGIGVAMVLFAGSGLVLLVRRDLAPAGRLAGALDGGGRWFLGAALGVGVIAFALKLGIILTLSTFPGQTIQPLIPDPAEAGPPPWSSFPLPESGPLGYAWQALPAVAPAPPDNPTTPEKVALGQRLFHDPALSRDHSVSCASCHDVDAGAGTDRRPTAVGITGVPGTRNSPTVWNAAFQARLFWDGRAGSLEEQAMGPPLNPNEMGMPSVEAIESRVAAEPSYRDAFAAAFGPDRPITMRHIVQAIAAYERTLVAGDAPYDRFVRGDTAALTPAQQRGMWLFQSLGCVTCHAGPNFSGASAIGPKTPYAPLMASRSDYARRHDLAADKGRPTRAGPRRGPWTASGASRRCATSP